MNNQPAWRNDPPTDKQLQAISNMHNALGWAIITPNTKGEASDIIGKAHLEIQNRISATGYVRPRLNTGFFNDDYDEDDWDDNGFMNDFGDS